MFEEEMEILKRKYELICEELSNITEEYNKNVNDQKTVENLKNLRNDYKINKFYSLLFPITCLIIMVLACLGFFVISPKHLFVDFILVILLSGGGISLTLMACYGSLCIICKKALKKNATVENLELEKNIEEILSKGISLEEKLNIIKENKEVYEDLINYFDQYNNKASLLESVVKDEKNNLENLFNEYLEERVDYSKVHLTECVLPDKVKIKSLTNRIK